MSEIEITHPDPDTGGTRLVIDGVDLSMAARSASIEVGSGRPRVTVELMAAQSFRLCSPDAELIIDDRVADMLEAHGWKRPHPNGGMMFAGPDHAIGGGPA